MIYLADDSHQPFPSVSINLVPYRNSMMTSVLRDSLGGNCKHLSCGRKYISMSLCSVSQSG
jgi:hypothetical protein